MHATDIASMYIALTKFVGAVYPDHLDYVDRVLQSCCAVSSLPFPLLNVPQYTEAVWARMHLKQLYSLSFLGTQCNSVLLLAGLEGPFHTPG